MKNQNLKILYIVYNDAYCNRYSHLLHSISVIYLK